MKKWEIALALGMACLLTVTSWAGYRQRSLAGEVVRFHVLANSDGEADQTLKLEVRDAVLAQADALAGGADSVEEAKTILGAHLEQLAQTGETVVRQKGYSYPVSASLEQCYFPTKHYADFSLPAGVYQALRIVIGSGQGHNWWCVVYPALCTSSVEEVSAETAGDSLSEDDISLMTGEDGGYEVRFHCVELWGEFCHWADETLK